MTLRQDAPGVVDPDRDQFNLRPRHYEVEDASFERPKLAARSSRAFGEEDERIPGVQCVNKRAKRIERPYGASMRTVDEDGVENAGSKPAAQDACGPVIRS